MSATDSTLIEVRDAAFGHDGNAVVEDVNLTVKRGGFLAVLGPNGGGKTTLLRGLLGTLKPMRGEVRQANGGRLRFGYVPQRESLDPIWPVTAMEVTLMGAYGRALRRMGLPLGRAERELAAECLDRVGGTDFQRRLYSELSGGQKQRVLIARGLMMKPDMLLLDEPASGLDVSAQHELIELLGRIRSGGDLTIVMISHHLARLETLADNVAWVHSGRVEVGPAETMLSAEKIHEVFFE